jgi:hypothetical protein
MHDDDGQKLEALFAKETLDLNDIAYALDEALEDLRNQGVQASAGHCSCTWVARYPSGKNPRTDRNKIHQLEER